MQENISVQATIIKQDITTAVLIANPTSGSYLFHAQQYVDTIAYLHNLGWQVELCLTRAAGDARRIAREAVAQKLDIVVAIGGDGTINEIIQELAGSETALGVLPSGTVNVWAREVGIPLDCNQARTILHTGSMRQIDLGRLNDRYFLLMTGFGIDGEVTHAVEKKPIKRLGVLGYLLMGTWLGLGYHDFQAILGLGDKTIKTNAIQIIIGNTRLYGGAVKYTWQAKCDDNLLDICIFRKQPPHGRIMTVLDFLLRRRQRLQWVRYENASQITLNTRRPIAIQLDGDPYGYTNPEEPTIITVQPAALKVIVPWQSQAEIFSQP